MKSSREPKPSVEWLCGVLTIPTQLIDPNNQTEPLQSLIWMIPNGPVLGSLTLEPDQVPSAVVIEHFRETTRSPLIGKPHSPERIRVANEELADALRAELSPTIPVVCAPTPELDALLESMTEFMSHRQPEAPSYLSAEVTSDMMAAFFRAAAALYRAQPWTCLPSDVPLLLDVEALALQGAALVIMGHGNQEYGFLLFSSQADFKGFLHAAQFAQPNVHPPMPLFALNYNRGADIPVELRKEATTHGWQVAKANAYPAITVLDALFTERSPTPTQLKQAEAIALALAEFAQSRRDANAAKQPQPTAVTTTVQTHAGPTQVKLALASVTYHPANENTSTGTTQRPRAASTKKRRKY